MNRYIPFFVLVILTASTAIAQERPRYFVEVTERVPSGPAATTGSVRHYIPNPQTGYNSDYARSAGVSTEQASTQRPAGQKDQGPYVIVGSAPRQDRTSAGHGPNASESTPRQYMSPPPNSYVGQGPSGYPKEASPRTSVPASGSNTVALTVQSGPRQYMQPPASAMAMRSTTKANMSLSLRGYSTGDDMIDSYILDSSRRYNIDPLLIYSQMGKESSYKPTAVSPKGASGLMQLMPKTAQRMGVTNIFDPKQNIEGGVKYMRLLLDMFDGDIRLALAGYNAGEQAVIRYG